MNKLVQFICNGKPGVVNIGSVDEVVVASSVPLVGDGVGFIVGVVVSV